MNNFIMKKFWNKNYVPTLNGKNYQFQSPRTPLISKIGYIIWRGPFSFVSMSSVRYLQMGRRNYNIKIRIDTPTQRVGCIHSLKYTTYSHVDLNYSQCLSNKHTYSKDKFHLSLHYNHTADKINLPLHLALIQIHLETFCPVQSHKIHQWRCL